MARGWGTEGDARGLERIVGALERIADALEAQNAQKPDTSFGDPRRLVEHPNAPHEQPYWETPGWTPTWTTAGSGYAPARDGEGDHLLNPEADHTGEETD